MIYLHLSCNHLAVHNCQQIVATCACPRSFDIPKGEHPVKWLVETLSYGSGILDALLTWFGEILPGVEKQEASQL